MRVRSEDYWVGFLGLFTIFSLIWFWSVGLSPSKVEGSILLVRSSLVNVFIVISLSAGLVVWGVRKLLREVGDASGSSLWERCRHWLCGYDDLPGVNDPSSRKCAVSAFFGVVLILTGLIFGFHVNPFMRRDAEVVIISSYGPFLSRQIFQRNCLQHVQLTNRSDGILCFMDHVEGCRCCFHSPGCRLDFDYGCSCPLKPKIGFISLAICSVDSTMLLRLLKESLV